MNSKNLLFCILDSRYSVSNRIQHQVISSFCDERGFVKGFYGAEDPSAIQSSLYLKWKIDTLDPKYVGLVIFSMHQYQPCDRLLPIVKTLVSNGKVFCAASENVAIANEREFDEFFEMVTISTTSIENRKFWQID